MQFGFSMNAFREQTLEDGLAAIDDAGYDGFVTVELYPYLDTPGESARTAMAYLEAHGWA